MALSREPRLVVGKGLAQLQPTPTKEVTMSRYASRATEHQDPSPNTRPSHEVPAWQPGPFDYQKLDAYKVALQVLVEGDRLAKQLPRGYAKLADQLRRALLSAHLGVAEAASRKGADRRARFRCARGEEAEAAAALEAVIALQLAPTELVEPIIHLLGRLCAMLTRLAGVAR
jgi:four helix bundle protein